MWPLKADLFDNWSKQFCLPYEGSRPLQGRLSDDPHVEAALQGLLLFGPASWVLIGSLFRIAQLRGAELVVLPNRRLYFKLPVAITLWALQLAYFVRLISDHAAGDILASQGLFLVADAMVCVLSYLEHGRNVGPSALLTTYLVITIFSNLITAGLHYVAWNLCNIGGLATAGFAARLVLLVLESQTKKSILREPVGKLSLEQTAGFFGVLFFWWVNNFLRTGYSKNLSLDDMSPLDESLDAMKLRTAMQIEWDQSKKPANRFSLMRALFMFSWRQNAYLLIPRFLSVVLRCCQPLLVSCAISFVSKDLAPLENRNEAFRLLLLTFLIYTGLAICDGANGRLISRVNFAARLGLVGIIYNDCLAVKDGVFDESAALTLMSDDVDIAAGCADLVHDIWTQMLELGIGMYLLAGELGWVCIIPILVTLCMSRIVKYITTDIIDRQLSFSKATQTRISTTKAVLDSIKNIKMMGLVDTIQSRVQAVRDYEIGKYTAFYRLMMAYFVSSVGLHLFSPSFTLIFYAIQAQLRGAKTFDVQMAFTSLAIISIIATPANALLGVLPEAASVMAAFERIQIYLLIPEQEDKRVFLDKYFTYGGHGTSEATAADEPPESTAIKVDRVTLCPASTADPVLKDISTTWKKGDLVVVNGAVGTGKTSLVKALLGDLPQSSGVIATAYRSVAYCSQSPWLTNGTIKEIICGPLRDGDEIDDELYKRVIYVCDLQEDLNQMPDGDQTVIGSRGIRLSGGQKQRIALARAVISRQGLIILDDVLSSLDASTERHIVNNLIGPKGLLKELGTTVVLITHAVQHLPLADHIVILDEKGVIAEQGTWEDLRNAAEYTSNIDAETNKSESDIKDRDGTESKDVSPISVDESDSNLQEITRRTGDTTLYKYYFNAIGLPRVALLVGLLTLNAALVGLDPYWLKRMAESGGQYMWFYTGIYFLISVGAFSSVAVAVCMTFLSIAPHSGNMLHARLLHTLLHAPQSYFATTDTGATLNFFSTDIMMIDRSLPFALYQVLQAIFLLISQCVILSVVQPLIIFTLPFTALAVYLIQKFYLATSRQLRFIDLEARALVNTSFLETLEGVSSIRAFGWQHAFVWDNAKKMDLSLRPDYMLMCIQRWLDIVLDLIVPGLALAVIGLYIALKGTTTGGQIGIALNLILRTNKYILRLVSSWTRLETSLGAISRVRAFEQDVQPEDKPGKQWPASSWPAHGAIEFSNLSASYKPPMLALDNINMAIAPGTKVGVVGRTGSGKSSLLLSLLRLIELQGSGTVHVDGLDLGDLPRDAIRARIITVPQDPMLVKTDTVRQNLDIAGADISDDDMVRVLERVSLWKVMLARRLDEDGSNSDDASSESSSSSEEAAPKKPQPAETLADDNIAGSCSQVPVIDPTPSAILNTSMKRMPLSQGQEQLFSLARALLMRPLRGRVVLLDEATSSVDSETDKLMQKIVREDFQEHTVITVAHRLDTIMDSDVLLVLHGGKLVETGPPSELAEKEGGMFKALLSQKK